MSRRTMQQVDFRAMKACTPDLTASLVSLGTDIALLIDEQGVVAQVAQSGHRPMSPAAADWVGRRWADTVTPDTRAKIVRMLADVRTDSLGLRREVNHSAYSGRAGTDEAELPVAYAAIRMGQAGQVLALGRDLRSWAAAQQRMVAGQQDLEGAYWQQRHAAQETVRRGRLLEQAAAPRPLVVCTRTLRLLDAHPAATAGWPPGDPTGFGAGLVTGQTVQTLFDSPSWPQVRLLLQTARLGQRRGRLPVRLAGSHRTVGVSTLVPQDQVDGRCLLHIHAPEGHEVFDASPQGLLVTDGTGRVLCGNRTLAHRLGLPGEAELRGLPLAALLQAGDTQALALLKTLAADGVLAAPSVAWLPQRTVKADEGDTWLARVCAHLFDGGDSGALCGWSVQHVDGSRLEPSKA